MFPQKGKSGCHLNVSKHPNRKSEQQFSGVEVLLNRKHWCQSGSNNVVDEHWIHYENIYLFCLAFCSAGGLNKLNRISHGWHCFRAFVVSTVTKFIRFCSVRGTLNFINEQKMYLVPTENSEVNRLWFGHWMFYSELAIQLVNCEEKSFR